MGTISHSVRRRNFRRENKDYFVLFEEVTEFMLHFSFMYLLRCCPLVDFSNKLKLMDVKKTSRNFANLKIKW